jgi:Tim10/DDP family zinc finger
VPRGQLWSQALDQAETAVLRVSGHNYQGEMMDHAGCYRQCMLCCSLRMYNSLVEKCFKDCVDSFRRKDLESSEEKVIDWMIGMCAQMSYAWHALSVGSHGLTGIVRAGCSACSGVARSS